MTTISAIVSDLRDFLLERGFTVSPSSDLSTTVKGTGSKDDRPSFWIEVRRTDNSDSVEPREGDEVLIQSSLLTLLIKTRVRQTDKVQSYLDALDVENKALEAFTTQIRDLVTADHGVMAQARFVWRSTDRAWTDRNEFITTTMTVRCSHDWTRSG